MTKEAILDIIIQAEAYEKYSDDTSILPIFASLLHALLSLTVSISTFAGDDRKDDMAEYTALKHRITELRDELSPFYELCVTDAANQQAQQIRKEISDEVKINYLRFVQQLYTELQIEYSMDEFVLNELFWHAAHSESSEFDLTDLRKEFVELYEHLQYSVDGYERMYWLGIRSIRLYFAAKRLVSDEELEGACFDLMCRTVTTLCVNGHDMYDGWDPDEPDSGYFNYDQPMYPYPSRVSTDQAGVLHHIKDVSLLQLDPAYSLYQTLKNSN